MFVLQFLERMSKILAFWHRDCSKCLSVVEKLTLSKVRDLLELLLVVHTSSSISTFTKMDPLRRQY